MEVTLEQPKGSHSRVELGQPVMTVRVEKRKKKKNKKKRKETMIVRVIGRLALGSAAALGQVGEAVRGASDKYTSKHRESREKRRDGWKKKFGSNLAKATSVLMLRSARAATKFAEAVWKKDKKKRKKKRSKDALRRVLVQPTYAGQSAVPGVPVMPVGPMTPMGSVMPPGSMPET